MITLLVSLFPLTLNINLRYYNRKKGFWYFILLCLLHVQNQYFHDKTSSVTKLHFITEDAFLYQADYTP